MISSVRWVNFWGLSESVLAQDIDSQDWQPYYTPRLLLILLWARLPWPPCKRHLIFSPPSSLSMRPSVVQNEFSLICMTDKRILYLFNRRSYARERYTSSINMNVYFWWVPVSHSFNVCMPVVLSVHGYVCVEYILGMESNAHAIYRMNR